MLLLLALLVDDMGLTKEQQQHIDSHGKVSHQDIADELGCSERSVRRYRRGQTFVKTQRSSKQIKHLDVVDTVKRNCRKDRELPDSLPPAKLAKVAQKYDVHRTTVYRTLLEKCTELFSHVKISCWSWNTVLAHQILHLRKKSSAAKITQNC